MSPAVPGLRRINQSGSKIRETTSDARRQFRIRVPPGRYTVLEPLYNTDRQREDFAVRAGQCALFQLETREHDDQSTHTQ